MTGAKGALARGRTGGSKRPSLRVERALQRDGFALLAGMDEVGRGALAGPVTVGVVVISDESRTAPAGVRDSKLLTPIARERLAPRIQRWAVASAVGHASPQEVDQIGVIAALRLAGTRALAEVGVVPDLVILDGNHDWLTPPERVGLLAFTDGLACPAVKTMIKADLRCSSVAAASVLAKVARDRLMVDLAPQHPAYGWEVNKGYAAPGHRAALNQVGPCAHHRLSWNLHGDTGDMGDMGDMGELGEMGEMGEMGNGEPGGRRDDDAPTSARADTAQDADGDHEPLSVMMRA